MDMIFSPMLGGLGIPKPINSGLVVLQMGIQERVEALAHHASFLLYSRQPLGHKEIDYYL